MSRRAAFLAVLLGSAPAASGEIWRGAVFVVPGVWVGGGAGTGVTASYASVISAAQPAVGDAGTTTSYILHPGFVQPFTAAPSGGGVGGVDPSRSETLQFTLATGCLQVTVPAACFSAPVTLSATAPGAMPSAVSRVAKLNGTGVGTILSVNPPLSPRKPLAVRACYRDADVAGLDESRLRLAVLPSGGDQWLPLPSSPDAAANTVTAAWTATGLWRIVEVLPSDGVGEVKVYPNPLVPAQGAMTFSNLPEDARLRLYDFAGKEVRELRSDGLGQAVWDGTDGGGRGVASGTYFVYVQGTGGRKTLKVQVQK